MVDELHWVILRDNNQADLGNDAEIAAGLGDLDGDLDNDIHDYGLFRDAFGAFWTLRILGRANQTAEFRGWPMRLTWFGFNL